MHNNDKISSILPGSVGAGHEDENFHTWQRSRGRHCHHWQGQEGGRHRMQQVGGAFPSMQSDILYNTLPIGAEQDREGLLDRKFVLYTPLSPVEGGGVCTSPRSRR
jgi:hypothetical protein